MLGKRHRPAMRRTTSMSQLGACSGIENSPPSESCREEKQRAPNPIAPQSRIPSPPSNERGNSIPVLKSKNSPCGMNPNEGNNQPPPVDDFLKGMAPELAVPYPAHPFMGQGQFPFGHVGVKSNVKNPMGNRGDYTLTRTESFPQTIDPWRPGAQMVEPAQFLRACFLCKRRYTMDGQKPDRWVNPSSDRDQAYKQRGGKELGNPQQRTVTYENASAPPRNVGAWGQNGKANWAMQSSPKPKNLESAVGNMDRRDLAVPPPLVNGWQWGRHNGGSANLNSSMASPPPGKGVGQGGAKGSEENSELGGKMLSKLLPFEQSGEPCHETSRPGHQSSDGDEEIDNLDSDDDFMSSDDCDSDGSDASHETLKKNKWFKLFFESLDRLSIDEMNDPERQWHCPACRGGVGAIDWYRGMQPIVAHAKSIRSKRVKLHRKLAEVLEEELARRGSACVIAEEMFGKWKGLRETVNDQEIVWPPMVIIQNTLLDQDENEKWIGMGNKELVEYFKGYKAMKARHAYGPKGHRGMSVLIFEESAMGYLEAERLHKQFLKEGRGKDDWERRPVLFHPGGQRILYGYFATKEEMEIFNRHSKGKTSLKYDMRSYHKMVVEPMRQMDEDNQKLTWFKTKVAKQQEHSRTLEETVSIVASKLRMRETEIKIIRQRATEQHEECKKEMDYLEQSYRQQIDKLNEDVLDGESQLAKMQEDFNNVQLDRCHQLEVDSAKLPKDTQVVNDEQQEQRIKIDEEIARRRLIVETSLKHYEEYERVRQELIKTHDQRRRGIKLRQLQEEIAFEKEVERERLELLEKYQKKRQEVDSDAV